MCPSRHHVDPPPSDDASTAYTEAAVGLAVVAGAYLMSSRSGGFQRLVGWVERHRPRRADDLMVTGGVAAIVAVIIAQRRTDRIVRRLRHASRTDALTGLPNRAWLMERLEHALTRRRTNTELAVYFLDLDGYKQVNDRWGHAAGDAVLVEVAHRLQASVRAHDTVARVGGDEFVVLVEDLELAEVELVGKRLRSAIPDSRATARDDLWPLSASIGVALVRDDTETATDLMARADAAMYEAKYSGDGCRISR